MTITEKMSRAMKPLVSDDMAEPFKSAWLADLSQAALTAITEAGYRISKVEDDENDQS